MKTYLVGGAVRDALLGLPVKDRDWVVVGATPQEMLAKGFKPVGKDFPVFLHPVTHEEYALARTERKTAPGYRGFVVHASPEVTLEEDLARRDITINSIAVNAIGMSTNGPNFSKDRLIDPFGGQNDLQHKVLRHVTDAFREDPVRILRVARFAARFPAFTVAPETLVLMQHMVHSGEVAALVPERVWQELSRGLMEGTPSRLLAVLAQCGTLPQLLPPAQAVYLPVSTIAPAPPNPWTVLDRAAQLGAPLPVRYALLNLLWQNPAGAASPLLKRLPRDCSELANLLVSEITPASQCDGWNAAEWMRWFMFCDAFRRPQRFLLLATACGLWLQRDLPAAAVLAVAQAVRLSDAAPGCGPAAAHSAADGPEIAARLHAARALAIARHLAVTLR